MIFGKFIVADGYPKHCMQTTAHYGKRLISTYETAECYYGDIGENETKNGLCQIDIDPIFAEYVNLKNGYQVFLTPYGKGELFVLGRFENYFVVCGDNMKFGRELKAKRRGFENDRLKEYRE